MALLYLIIMWVWWVGGTVWLLNWAQDDEGFAKLGIAALYFAVSVVNGIAALAYSHSGQ